MSVDRSDSLVRAGLEQLRRDHFLDREHDAVLAPDADGCAAVLDGLHRVLDLEIPPVGGEDGVGQVIARSY